MKKIILIFLLLFSIRTVAQEPGLEGDGLTIGKLGVNKVALQGSTAIDSIAWIVGEGGTLSLRIADTYSTLFSLKKLYSTAPDTCVMLQRTLNSDSAYFGFVNGILDTASVRSWLDTNIVVNGDFANWTGDDPDNWTISGESGIGQEITESSGKCRIVSDGTLIWLYENILDIGSYYRITLDITNVTSGEISLQKGSSATIHNIVILDSVGSYEIDFLAEGINFGIKRYSICDITFDNIRITEITPSVRKWWDVSGNNNFAYQYNPDYQPIVDLDSFQLEFDGGNDYMVNDMGEFAQPNSYITVGTFNYAENNYLFSGSGSVNAFLHSVVNLWRIYAGVYLNYSNNDNHTNIACLFNGANSFSLIDGVKTSGDAGTNTTKDLRISCNRNYTLFEQNDFKSFIFSQYGLTQTQSERILDYLNE